MMNVCGWKALGECSGKSTREIFFLTCMGEGGKSAQVETTNHPAIVTIPKAVKHGLDAITAQLHHFEHSPATLTTAFQSNLRGSSETDRDHGYREERQDGG